MTACTGNGIHVHNYCKTNQIPAELCVGDVLEESNTMKTVKLWDMRKPQPIAQLSNRYETGHVSLCGLFSTTIKKASVSLSISAHH